MSRVAKAPVTVPNGVTVTQNGRQVEVKGSKGTLSFNLHALVELKQEEGKLQLAPAKESKDAWMQAGTARAVLNNLVKGVSEGFERKLQLVGVGYKAAVKGTVVNLNLGYSHPIDYALPEGVTAETPTATEIILKSANKQLLGQVAAEIRVHTVLLNHIKVKVFVIRMKSFFVKKLRRNKARGSYERKETIPFASCEKAHACTSVHWVRLVCV